MLEFSFDRFIRNTIKSYYTNYIFGIKTLGFYTSLVANGL